jgi:hypothetical protein
VVDANDTVSSPAADGGGFGDFGSADAAPAPAIAVDGVGFGDFGSADAAPAPAALADSSFGDFGSADTASASAADGGFGKFGSSDADFAVPVQSGFDDGSSAAMVDSKAEQSVSVFDVSSGDVEMQFQSQLFLPLDSLKVCFSAVHIISPLLFDFLTVAVFFLCMFVSER